MSTPAELAKLCVVLVRTRNPLNIGAAARAMSNLGFSRLRLVNPYEPSFREARSAPGAAEVLTAAQEYESVAEAVADCTLVVGTTALRKRELRHRLLRLEHGGREIRDHLRSGQVALLFGSEKRGLSNDDLSHCHWLTRIPARDEHGSMNLGQAVAVCLYELVRKADAPRALGKRQPANAGDIERITGLLFDALQASGYVKPGSGKTTREKLRRQVQRLEFEAEDAKLWLGMLRQILWKLRNE